MELLAPPAVLGHEGVGVIEKMGREVKGLGVGDRVALSYPWCATCSPCREGRPFHCVHGLDLSFAGHRADGSRPVSLGGKPIASAFFQQSSFATHAVALARDAVKLPDDLPSELAAALPCGVQTGAGAILRSLATKPGESVAVFGVGAVGLSALMAAKLAGAGPVIAVDVNPGRLQLALSLGATHSVHAGDADVASSLRQITGGGVQVLLDTSGKDVALRRAIDAMATGGRLGIVTVPDWGKDYRLPIQPLFERFGSLVSIIQGSSIPATFLPYLIEQYRAGRFPFDRLVTAYPFAQINQAVEDARRGQAVKPVLLMP